MAKRFGPHALAVSLLGVYLYENDPRHGTGAARALEQLPGDEPLDRVLAGFEQWLAASAELGVLRLLGLFDRPADAGCLGAVRAKPPIPGLTDRVVESSDAGWDHVLDRLEKLRLVHRQSRGAGPPTVDAHPLLREHFAKQLRERQPEAWREGHRRLYEYLKATVPYQPEGLAGLQPLYQAVAHGCQAGLHQDACDEVYVNRILRGTEADGFYSTNKLGAFGVDLGAVACFFEEPWKRLAPGLPKNRPGVDAQSSSLSSPCPGPACRITGADAGLWRDGREAQGVERSRPQLQQAKRARADFGRYGHRAAGRGAIYTVRRPQRRSPAANAQARHAGRRRASVGPAGEGSRPLPSGRVDAGPA